MLSCCEFSWILAASRECCGWKILYMRKGEIMCRGMVMSGRVRIAFCVVLSTLFLTGVLNVAVSPVAAEYLVWEGSVYSSGAEVYSPVLGSGGRYRIEVGGIWWYDWDENLAADAMYYTTSASDSWDWPNHFPAPGGHSFLQINSLDVDWGLFSNGDTGHMYSIRCIGNGTSVSFRIVDWMDGNYGNNDCHFLVRIYGDCARERETVGGYVVDSDSSPEGLFTPWIIGAFVLSVGVTVPLVSCYKKLRDRKD